MGPLHCVPLFTVDSVHCLNMVLTDHVQESMADLGGPGTSHQTLP